VTQGHTAQHKTRWGRYTKVILFNGVIENLKTEEVPVILAFIICFPAYTVPNY
jgi:hypothetical protein